MDVCWFWCFLQEGEGDLYERMGEVHACGHLPQMSTCIFSNPHHNPSRLVSPPTSTQWHKATSSRPTASQLWLQSKSRLSSQKGHIPFCPEFLILSKVCQWDKVIVTEKDMPLSVLHLLLVELNYKDLNIKKSKDSRRREIGKLK